MSKRPLTQPSLFLLPLQGSTFQSRIEPCPKWLRRSCERSYTGLVLLLFCIMHIILLYLCILFSSLFGRSHRHLVPLSVQLSWLAQGTDFWLWNMWSYFGLLMAVILHCPSIQSSRDTPISTGLKLNVFDFQLIFTVYHGYKWTLPLKVCIL